jgi:glycosyltransferase involved in cell wall biosynthesis
VKIVFTMPVFNEQEGIVDFCNEILEVFEAHEVELVLVNDQSSDNSRAVITKHLLSRHESKIKVIDNERNLGHGPSTLIGISDSLTRPDVEVIVTVDGDGQFRAQEILTLVNGLLELNLDIVEGVRVNRQDPIFRKISTAVCRLLVLSSAGKLPRDGNTCLRVYRPNSLRTVIEGISPDFLIPNVLISTQTRIRGLAFAQIEINSIPRRGNNSLGSTWHQRFYTIPSRRYLAFCIKAIFQWAHAINRIKRR